MKSSRIIRGRHEYLQRFVVCICHICKIVCAVEEEKKGEENQLKGAEPSKRQQKKIQMQLFVKQTRKRC